MSFNLCHARGSVIDLMSIQGSMKWNDMFAEFKRRYKHWEPLEVKWHAHAGADLNLEKITGSGGWWLGVVLLQSSQKRMGTSTLDNLVECWVVHNLFYHGTWTEVWQAVSDHTDNSIKAKSHDLNIVIFDRKISILMEFPQSVELLTGPM